MKKAQSSNSTPKIKYALAEKYKEKFYSESQWIQELERLRLTTIQDLIEVPLGELTN